MIKILRTLGFITFFITILCVVIGFNSDSEIRVSQTYQIQAPATSIWQYMNEPDRCKEWINQVAISNCALDSKNLICYADQLQKYVVFSISRSNKNKSLQLVLHPDRNNPFIKDYFLQYELKSLKDGSTEINSSVHYNLKSIMAKVLNRIYFEGHQKSLMDANIEDLSKHFENT